MADDLQTGPVERLLALGEPAYTREFAWPDYQTFGIGPEHIPDLVALATDHQLINSSDESDPRSWGPVHAWRALGQLGALEAVEPLMRLFHEIRDNDWMIEEMPDVFAMIGPGAFKALSSYLLNEQYPVYSRLVASTSLMQMGIVHPEVKLQVIEVLAEQLCKFTENGPGMNGVLIANLVELNAASQSALIQKVFAEGQVDRFIVGDWRDIKNRLRPPSRPNGSNESTLKKSAAAVPPDPVTRLPNSDQPAAPGKP